MFFSDTPTQTPVLQHDIDVGDGLPIRWCFLMFLSCFSGEKKHVDTGGFSL